MSFCAVDGEGRNSGRKHNYYLLCNSNGEVIERAERLSTIECLRFLYRSASSADFCVGYGLTYDFTKMLEDLADSDIKALFHKQRLRVSQDGESFDLHMVMGKWLQINDAFIYDVFSFFQKSFVSSLRDWEVATSEEVATIQHMKGQRGRFNEENPDDIRAYCISECRLLVQLMEKLSAAFDKLGIELKKWHGPGAVAHALLKLHDTRKFRRLNFERKEQYSRVFRSAYYGGRFELATIGRIEGPLYDYDINSAYPYALTKLPCLNHSSWKWTGTYKEGVIGVYHVSWQLGVTKQPDCYTEPYKWGPFPFRFKSGAIVYPNHGEGWYWSYEIEEAVKMRGLRLSILEGMWLEQHCDDVPFSWIHDLYRIRQQYKLAGDLAHMSLRLGYNSLYGKFAEKDFEDGHKPFWQTYTWAGMITSMCRAQILGALNNAANNGIPGSSVVCIATDGLMATNPIPGLATSLELGEWEYHEYDSAFIAQSGIARLTAGEQTIYKTRGNIASEIDWEKLESGWRVKGPSAFIGYRTTRFMSVGACTIRRDFRQYLGTWTRANRQISMWPTRRQIILNTPMWPSDANESLPYMQRLPHKVSAPYRADMTDAERDPDVDISL